MIRSLFIRIRPAIRSQKGFTLVELIVTLVLVGIIGTFTTLFMYTGLNGYLKAKDTSEGALKAQIALDRISLELKDIKEISDINSDTNIDYECESEALLFTRAIRYDPANKEILLSVAGNENVLLDDVQTFSLTPTYEDLNYYSGGDLEVKSIEVSFTIGEIERPFSARIFPRNMVDDPTS
jgi:prepilin-type N-terminal cleavage/methylation domain-containing protein